jgi:DNA-binding transcriptional ArsR family regulator
MINGQVADLPVDTTLRVLRAGPRRRALRCLPDAEEGLSVQELADRLWTDEPPEPAGTPTTASEQPNGAALGRRISLAHNHLPMLEETGIVEVDEQQCVTATERAGWFVSLLSMIRTFDRSKTSR